MSILRPIYKVNAGLIQRYRVKRRQNTDTMHIRLGRITVSLVTTAAVVAPLISSTGASPVLVGLASYVELYITSDHSFTDSIVSILHWSTVINPAK